MNHSRVDIRESTASCGVVEISRLSDDTEENLFVIANSFYHPARGNPPAFVMWSNLGNEETNGSRFRALLVARAFGYVWATAKHINPKTGSVIMVWIWGVDHESLKSWYLDKKVEKLRKAKT